MSDGLRCCGGGVKFGVHSLEFKVKGFYRGEILASLQLGNVVCKAHFEVLG